jgi:TolA-binding protein
VLVALLTGLALINAAGVFGKLVEAHVAMAATARAGVSERMQIADAHLTSQSATLADLDHRISQIDAAVEEATRRGRTAVAMSLVERQRSTRDGLSVQRRAASAALIEMQSQRAALTTETARVEAAAGPVQYLPVMVGTDAETAVRWLILLMVLCCDPAAIALTIAVAGARH